MTPPRWTKAVFVAGAVLCLWPEVSGAQALLLGMGLALAFDNPWRPVAARLAPKFLSLSVVGLGAGMSLPEVARVGVSGLVLTAGSIAVTFLMGVGLGRWLKTEKETSVLLSAGTAICGGSAIAAVAPVLKARPQAVSVALGVVFLLNAAALVVFPAVGQWLSLSQAQFGWWCALAIHDTSSVVGATLHFGEQALSVGTTVKLARALYIVPLTWVLSGVLQKNTVPGGPPPKRPWFILGFVAMAAAMTWLPFLAPAKEAVVFLARRGLVVSLFLIGAQWTRHTLRTVGPRPFLQGFFLWVLTALASLLLVTLAF